jgi:hypothetical protein
MNQYRLFGVAIVTAAVLLALIGCSDSRGGVLPDVMASVRFDQGAERIRNTRDEYAPLISRYGTPSSVDSTENDPDKPPVPTMIVRYDTAHVKIALVPIGCAEPYIKTAEILSEASRYPALARDFVDKMRDHPCVRSAPGWTIMGYIDSSDNTAISAGLTRRLLDMKN